MNVSVIVKFPPLKEICIQTIADNFDALVKKSCDTTEGKIVWRFPYPDGAMPPSSANMLLKELGGRKMLKKEHLTLFSKQYVQLHHLALRDLSLSPSSISVFRDFTFYNITAVNLSGIGLHCFINSFNSSTMESLHTLDVTNMSIEKEKKLSAMAALAQLQNLHILNVSRTSVDSDCLGVLVKSLKRLRSLDISETKVTDISCLTEVKNGLSRLYVNHLEKCTTLSFSQMLLTISEMKELRLLEVSNLNTCADIRLFHANLLLDPQVLPHLEHLEMSGNPFGLTASDIQNFVGFHRDLKLLGLLRYPADEFNKLALMYPNVKILGGKGDIEAVKSLQHYAGRGFYVHDILLSVDYQLRLGSPFQVNFFKFLVNYLEREYEESGLTYSTGTCIACRMIRNANSNDIPSKFLQRMLNYAFTVIEKELMKFADGGNSSLDGSDSDVEYESNDDSSESESEDSEFDESSDEYDEDGSDDTENDSNNSETEENDLDDGNDEADEDVYNNMFDFELHELYYCGRQSFCIRTSLLYLKRVIRINRVALDYKRCCAIVFKILQHINTAATRSEAISGLSGIINRMSRSELEEISANPSYIRCLIKCAAERYLPKPLFEEWLAARSDEKFDYLRDFHAIHTRNEEIIGVLKAVLTNGYQASAIFITSGGPEVFAFILEEIEYYEMMAEVAIIMKEVLENAHEHLESVRKRRRLF